MNLHGLSIPSKTKTIMSASDEDRPISHAWEGSEPHNRCLYITLSTLFHGTHFPLPRSVSTHTAAAAAALRHCARVGARRHSATPALLHRVSTAVHLPSIRSPPSLWFSSFYIDPLTHTLS